MMAMHEGRSSAQRNLLFLMCKQAVEVAVDVAVCPRVM